jgi:hypothetical protein
VLPAWIILLLLVVAGVDIKRAAAAVPVDSGLVHHSLLLAVSLTQLLLVLAVQQAQHQPYKHLVAILFLALSPQMAAVMVAEQIHNLLLATMVDLVEEEAQERPLDLLVEQETHRLPIHRKATMADLEAPMGRLLAEVVEVAELVRLDLMLLLVVLLVGTVETVLFLLYLEHP